MGFGQNHEIHRRRFGRNLGVGLVLVAFVLVVFGLTVAKIAGGGQMSGISLKPAASAGQAAP